MTTNRLETMDVAFQSRVHMAIEYKPLSVAARRKIWTNIINRVSDGEAREELLDEIDSLKRLDLNGREIQNAMSVAQSLAMGWSNRKDGGRRGTAERLNVVHIKKVLDETSKFQRYFKSRKEVSRSYLRAHIQGQGNVRKGADDDDDGL
jgi:hypothetical protein